MPPGGFPNAPRKASRPEIQNLIPAGVSHRAAWAVDLQLVFAGLKLDPPPANVCAVLAEDRKFEHPFPRP
jgi:hypothetical protein